MMCGKRKKTSVQGLKMPEHTDAATPLPKLIWAQQCDTPFPKARELSTKVTKIPSPLALSSFGFSLSFLALEGIAAYPF